MILRIKPRAGFSRSCCRLRRTASLPRRCSCSMYEGRSDPPGENTMGFDRTWDDVFERNAAEQARDADMVQRRFWAKVKRLAAQLPFAEDLVTAYYCAFDRATPFQVKAALVDALAYFVLPTDVVPDILPALGFADDAAVLAAALRMVVDHIRPEHRDAPRPALARGLDPG